MQIGRRTARNNSRKVIPRDGIRILSLIVCYTARKINALVNKNHRSVSILWPYFFFSLSCSVLRDHVSVRWLSHTADLDRTTITHLITINYLCGDMRIVRVAAGQALPQKSGPSAAKWFSAHVLHVPHALHIFFFHSRNYYKLSLCVTFGNTFDNLWKSWRAYAQWRMLYKLQYDQVHKS